MKTLPAPQEPARKYDAPTVTTTGQPPERRRLRSDDLLGGQREVLIEHAGDCYTLRHTRQGKLILTK